MMLPLSFSKTFVGEHGRLLCMQKRVGRLLVRNWHKEPIQVAWRKPEMGWTKLNFDASCNWKTGRSSIGGVLRNHEAEFLLGYAEPIAAKSNSNIAEMVALQRGLELTLENDCCSNVWVEGDSMSLVQIIAQKRDVRHEQAHQHISNINLMIRQLNNCILTHTYREGNRAADKFAQLGHHFQEPQIWRYTPPHQVLRIVHEDAQGKIFRNNKFLSHLNA